MEEEETYGGEEEDEERWIDRGTANPLQLVSVYCALCRLRCLRCSGVVQYTSHLLHRSAYLYHCTHVFVYTPERVYVHLYHCKPVCHCTVLCVCTFVCEYISGHKLVSICLQVDI